MVPRFQIGLFGIRSVATKRTLAYILHDFFKIYLSMYLYQSISISLFLNLFQIVFSDHCKILNDIL